MKSLQFIAALIFSGALGWMQTSSGADRMVGVAPSDGVVMLVKQFDVLAGTTILGAQFSNNDRNTVFPEVAFIRGPLTAVGDGTPVRSVSNAREDVPGAVEVLWSEPVVVSEDAPYYVTVRFPNGPSKQGTGIGPAVGASNVAEPTGSFIAPGSTEPLIAIRADLDIQLLAIGSVGKGASSPDTPGPDATEAGGTQMFLASSTPTALGGPTRMRFGLERSGMVSLVIYDVAGRHVSTLVQGALEAGSHELLWDGRDDRGERVGAGVYVVALQAGGQRMTRKLVTIK